MKTRKITCGACGCRLETDAEAGEEIACGNCGATIRTSEQVRELPKAEPFVQPLATQFLRAIAWVHLAFGAGLSLALLILSALHGSDKMPFGLSVLAGLTVCGVAVIAAFPFFASAQILEAICRTAHEARRTNVLLEEIANRKSQI